MRRGTGAAFVFLLAVVLAPVWTADVLPLQDYPNHIARLHILTRLAQPPALSSTSGRTGGSIPTLASTCWRSTRRERSGPTSPGG
jgi:hypothetical protein